MVIGLIACLAACKKEQPQSPIPDSPASLQKLFNPAYQISTDSIHRMIRSYLDENKQVTPWDSALVAYYQEKDEFFWLNDSLVSDKPATQPADSLLYWLGNISKHGIHPGLYLTDSIRNDLEQIRTLQLQGKKTMNRLLADVEYRLTSAYLSYVCRLKFGFLPPERRWNDSIDRIPLKRCDKEFALAALDSLRTDANAAFRRAQPSSQFYKKMQEELERVNSWGETDTTDYYRNRLLVNMERARWQYALEKGKKYVVANTAAFMLQAVNEETDSILEMRICVGSVKNRTPLLSSKIYYMELNPYWNVPQSIIRKEIIPTYRRDTTYFTRNRMKVYDKNGTQVDPHSIKWAKYAGKGVPYTVKQDNKAGNSLGRIIFRFPNPYSVYLHDTPSKWAFSRKNRAVSHGCVRLQKALDFAFFLLKKPDELLEDRIRIAMDIKPVSEEGKKLPISAAYRELKHYSLEQYIPLFIDYQTVYLSADNNMRYCEDIYNYDPSLLEAMKSLNLKPKIKTNRKRQTMTPYNEPEVLKLLQEESTQRKGFEIIVAQYSEQLYWQIRRMVLSHEDANDLLQNTFIKAWTNIDYFRAEAKLSTWLYRIALNECLTFLNKQRATTTIAIDDPEAMIVQKLESDSYYSGDQVQLLLQKALLTLPEKQRMVFNLKYYQEMKYEDMSEIFGTSVGALKASYHHAVKKIEKFLEEVD